LFKGHECGKKTSLCWHEEEVKIVFLSAGKKRKKIDLSKTLEKKNKVGTGCSRERGGKRCFNILHKTNYLLDDGR